MLYLSRHDVESLHESIIETFGGLHGIRSIDLLESSVGQPEQSAFGEDAYPTIEAKAAAYGFFLTMNHPFMDGNKRTGAGAMLLFLDINNRTLYADDHYLASVITSLAAGEISKAYFFNWVAERCRRKEGNG